MNVATILAPLAERVQHRLGEPVPVAVSFWDGSALELLDAEPRATVIVDSPEALRQLLGDLPLRRTDRVAAAWAAWRVGALRATPARPRGSGSARRRRRPVPARARSRAAGRARARP